MLKKRIIAVIVVKNNIAVQSIGFKKYLPLGRPEIAAEFLSMWGIDEIILIDISATKEYRAPNIKIAREVAKNCQVPLSVGGGISTLDHVYQLMECGADKIVLNQILLRNPSFMDRVGAIFGKQCIVGSVDCCLLNGEYKVYDYLTKMIMELSVVDYVKSLERRGAGEIFLNMVDRDGKKNGLDIDLIHRVCKAISIPVIACGGAGNPYHFERVFDETDVSAIAASNFFHFYENSATITKAICVKNYPLRHETQAQYDSNKFDTVGRLLKKSEKELEEMYYVKIIKEVI